jgi:hypothetical protein
MKYPNHTYKYHGVVNNNVLCNVFADTITTLKRLASEHANPYWKTSDVMIVFDMETGAELFKMFRINSKRPNNTITFGKWN